MGAWRASCPIFFMLRHIGSGKRKEKFHEEAFCPARSAAGRIAAALLGVPVLAAGEEAAAGSLYGTVWALLPPVIAITLALITKEAYSSLFIGIVVGALFAKGFSPIGALDMIVNDGLVAAISDNAGIFLFWCCWASS